MHDKLFKVLKEYLGIECEELDSESVEMKLGEYETKGCIYKEQSDYGILGVPTHSFNFFIKDGIIGGVIHEDCIFNPSDNQIEFKYKIADNRIELDFENCPGDSSYHRIARSLYIDDDSIFVSFSDGATGMYDKSTTLKIRKKKGNYEITTKFYDYDSSNQNYDEKTYEGSFEAMMLEINSNERLKCLIPDIMNLINELLPALHDKILKSYPWVKKFVFGNDRLISSVDEFLMMLHAKTVGLCSQVKEHVKPTNLVRRRKRNS